MRRLLLLMATAALMLVTGAAAEEVDACPEVEGGSTEDRVGCLDSDGDGYSNPDENWTLVDGADAFPDDPLAWSDGDGDGYPDQAGASKSDDCPFTAGTSRVILLGWCRP